jgi:carbohydrate-selective porin OprB
MFEGEIHYVDGEHPGILRLLGYVNHANAGNYAEALHVSQQTGAAPDITAVRRNGTLKYGTGVNLEQQITKNVGVFARLGWNDGKTESFAFTAIDRLATGGVSVSGPRWKRPDDVAATELTVSGLSGVHASYLAHGGQDFLIGDGALRYGPEYIWESYYSARLFGGFFASIDLQHIANPAYNQDRGPVWIPSARLHLELKLHGNSKNP